MWKSFQFLMWKSKRFLTMRRENRPKLTFTVHLASLSYISKVALLYHSLYFYCNCILRPFLPSDRSSKCKRGAVLMWRSRLNSDITILTLASRYSHWCPVQALPSTVADASWRTLLSKRRLSIPPTPTPSLNKRLMGHIDHLSNSSLCHFIFVFKHFLYIFQS